MPNGHEYAPVHPSYSPQENLLLPPPPPPSYSGRQVDGPLEISPTAEPEHDVKKFQSSVGIEIARENSDNANAPYPLKSPLTPSLAGECIQDIIAPTIHDRQDLQEVKKSEPKRQVDDVTPNFKRRQPIVADAYR